MVERTRNYVMNLLNWALIIYIIQDLRLLKAQISLFDLGIENNQNEDAGSIQNKTYSEEQNELQRQIFANYDRNVRPRRNQTRSTSASIHVHLMHFSVQERKQSIKLYGHLYMSWFDEYAVWDPAKFNGVRTTLVNQWELWQPDLKVANSISGVNQYFEISKRSHATLTSIDANLTKVELYPTFAISIGCEFDFTDYPFDYQECALRFYTSSSMQDVELTLYYNLNPSVVLAWEEESNKKHISDWELYGVHANTSYFRYREYNSERPTDAFELMNTWSIILITIKLKRNALHYWFTLALPGFASVIINLLSFLVDKIETSMLMLIFNFFLQVIFMHDSLDILPPSVGGKPNIVLFSSFLLILTFSAVVLQILLKLANDKQWLMPKVVLKYTDLVFEKLNKFVQIILACFNSVRALTNPITQEAAELDESDESSELPKNSVETRLTLVKDVMRKVCIGFYLLLGLLLSLLLVF